MLPPSVDARPLPAASGGPVEAAPRADGKPRPWMPWVARSRDGDMSAFRELYEQTRPALHNVVSRLVDDEDEAAEIVQQAYVKAWQGLHELRDDAAFPGWLRRIAMNLLRDHWRRANRFDDLPPDDALDALADPTPGAESVLAERQGFAHLDRAVQDLPELFRLPVVLHYLDERPVEEVARLLDLPRGTILSRLARARIRLREYLQRGNHAS